MLLNDSMFFTACFFANSGHLATILLEDTETVTSDWYVNKCLPNVSQAWRIRRPQTGAPALLLLYGKTGSHNLSLTLVFLVENNVQIVTRPLYTLSLDPCKFFHLYLVKWHLKGKQLHSSKEERAFVEGAILPLRQSAWHGATANRFQRTAMCIHTD